MTAGLTFDENRHLYFYDGKPVPGVTSVLRPLLNFEYVSKEVMAAARLFGTALHRACELSDERRLNIVTLDPELVPYLRGWQAFCFDHQCQWSYIEQKVYHQVFRYAGTLDRRGLVDGQLSFVDIKTSASLGPAVGPQLAAYAQAFSSPMAAPLVRRLAVRLDPALPRGYEVKEYKSPNDWPVFCGLLTLKNWCAEHRIVPNFNESKHD